MSAIVNDPRARALAPGARSPGAAGDSASVFAEVLAAARGEHAAGFADTGPFGLARPETDNDIPRHTTRAIDATAAHASQAALTRSSSETQTAPAVVAPPCTPASHPAETFMPPMPAAIAHRAPRPHEDVAQRPTSPLALGARAARPLPAPPKPPPSTGARQSSPIAAHIAASADAVQIHIRVDSVLTDIATLRGDIEALFAERGVRVQLHINGRRVSGEEDENHG